MIEYLFEKVTTGQNTESAAPVDEDDDSESDWDTSSDEDDGNAGQEDGARAETAQQFAQKLLTAVRVFSAVLCVSSSKIT